MDEIQREIRGLTIRFAIGFLMEMVTVECCKRAGLDLKETKNRHVALYIASVFNEIANLSFGYVTFRVAIVPTVLARMRLARKDTNEKLVHGFAALFISLSFLAYFHCFVLLV